MKFITNHRKFIALVAIFAFAYLVGLGSMPLRAAIPSPDEQPGTIEKVDSSSTTTARKSLLLPIIIGVVGVGVVAALLILNASKSKYDITGTWDILYSGPSSGHGGAIFTGTKDSGNVQITEWWDGNGSYTVDGKKVIITHSLFKLTYTGEFTDNNTMSGTATLDFGGINTWNWRATRN